jgi:uncharacterized membrane protein YcjF (UPF0283 family)
MRVKIDRDNWRYLVLGALGLLFVGSIIWSIIFETLLPLWREGDRVGLAYNLIGIPIILTGTAVIVYGGFRFLRDMFAVSQNERLQANAALLHDKTADPAAVRQARWDNFKLLLPAWKIGFLWIVGGFLLIAVGGFLINNV